MGLAVCARTPHAAHRLYGIGACQQPRRRCTEADTAQQRHRGTEPQHRPRQSHMHRDRVRRAEGKTYDEMGSRNRQKHACDSAQKARTRLSVSACRISRAPEAPSALWMETCARRVIPRASRRFTTFAQAINRTIVHTASRIFKLLPYSSPSALMPLAQRAISILCCGSCCSSSAR